MKIVVFLNSLFAGGAERVTVNLANAWSRLGHEVTIVTLESEEKDFYRPSPAVKRLVIGNFGASKGICEAIRTNWKRLKSLREIVQQEKPDILLGIMTRASVMSMIASAGRRYHVIVTEHNHPPKLLPGKFWSFLRYVTYRRASRVIALTGESGDWLAKECGCQNISVIPNPVTWPIRNGEPTVHPDSFVSEGRKLILGVGRLVNQKGFDYLIEAFDIIRCRAESWDLVILGDGNRRLDLEKMIGERGLEGRVFLPGNCGNVSDWYSRSDIYALSSRFEGFPMTLIEAMSMGVPVVSYDCDTGPRDIIKDGENGRLVRPVGDVEALANSLEELINNEMIRSQIAARAVEVRSQYSEEGIVQTWLDLFLKLLESDAQNGQGVET